MEESSESEEGMGILTTGEDGTTDIRDAGDGGMTDGLDADGGGIVDEKREGVDDLVGDGDLFVGDLMDDFICRCRWTETLTETLTEALTETLTEYRVLSFKEGESDIHQRRIQER